MNPRIVGILVVLLVVLGGGALLFRQQESERRLRGGNRVWSMGGFIGAFGLLPNDGRVR